jgi:hypothetical protein
VPAGRAFGGRSPTFSGRVLLGAHKIDRNVAIGGLLMCLLGIRIIWFFSGSRTIAFGFHKAAVSDSRQAPQQMLRSVGS